MEAEVQVPEFDMNSLEALIKNLYLNEPFFGFVLNRINRRIDRSLEAAAALDIRTLNILINPIKFAAFTPLEQLAVLKHEVLHHAFYHPQRFSSFYEKVIAEHDNGLAVRLNIAMDAAINQLIPNIPEGCITLKSIEEIVAYIFKHDPSAYHNVLPTVEPKKSSEYYFALINHLVDDPNACPSCESGAGAFNKHKHLFGEGNNSEFHKKEMEQIIAGGKERQRAEDKIRGVGAGNSILDLMPNDKVEVHSKIWKNLISKAFGETPDAQKEMCYGRPSRRKNDSDYYTRRMMVDQHVYVGLDTSASVGDQELEDFIGYMNRAMRKYDVTITLIQCDWEIESVSKVRTISKSKGLAVHGRGGTDLTKILTWIEQNDDNPNNARLILLTDGETPWRESKVNTSVVYTPNHSKMDHVMNYAVIHKHDVFTP